MPKVRIHSIVKEDKFRIIGNFFEIVSNLRSKREIIDFFVGLLTPSEALMVGRRIQIAQLLLQGENYEDIRKLLKVSNQTITKTDQWLHSGDENYNQWLANRIAKKNKVVSKEDRANLLDRYAHHRVFNDLFK